MSCSRPPTAAKLALQIGDALDALHARGVMHRDVKAANILLQEDGSAALTDFGLAKGTGYEGLTAVGQIVGTIEYLAPERITGQEAAPASDLYALGCVIYESLVGKTPFAGKGPMGTAFGHLEEQPPDPCGVRDDVTPGVRRRRAHRARQGSRRPPRHRARLRRGPAGRAVWLTGGCRGSSRADRFARRWTWQGGGRTRGRSRPRLPRARRASWCSAAATSPSTSARRCARRVANREIDLTVVSGDNFQTFHGFVGEMITGRLSPSHILSPVRRMFAPARVRVGEIEKIDLAGRRAVVARQLDGHRTEITWDHVVISLGTDDRTDAYPGLEEHAFKLRQYRDCFALKNHILAMFEQAEFETEEAERRRLLTFFVAGGGYAGTEVVGELADFARRLTRREYPRVNYDECRFILVHPGPTILPELYGNHPKLVEYGEAHMRELGVEVRTGTRVEFATPNEVTLSNGERIPTRTIVSTVGTRPNPLVAALDLPKDERGRIRTERSGRVEGHENIWAGGDCSRVPDAARRRLARRSRSTPTSTAPTSARTCAARSSRASARAASASPASARARRSGAAPRSPSSTGSRSPACSRG